MFAHVSTTIGVWPFPPLARYDRTDIAAFSQRRLATMCGTTRCGVERQRVVKLGLPSFGIAARDRKSVV